MAHHTPGAPLVIWPLMAHLYLVRHCYIAVAHHIHGAPLVSILAIVVFLVVMKLFDARRRINSQILVVTLEYLGDIRVD